MSNTANELLFISEVAEACRAPVGTVRHWIREGRLESFRLGRRRVVRRDALERFLVNAGDVPPVSDGVRR